MRVIIRPLTTHQCEEVRSLNFCRICFFYSTCKFQCLYLPHRMLYCYGSCTILNTTGYHFASAVNT